MATELLPASGPVKLVPRISATVRERLIFNFAVEPEALAAHMQCPFLEPQVIRGAAVASFCILWLDDVSFSVKVGGIANHISCAFRYGAVDRDTGKPTVYVDERFTNSKIGAFVSNLGFPCHHPLVKVEDASTDDLRALRVLQPPAETLFEATIRRDGEFESSLFDSGQDFKDFLIRGTRSCTPSHLPNLWNIVDLAKEESPFVPIEVASLTKCRILDDFKSAKFDSAFRTSGAAYSWRFAGQVRTKIEHTR